MNGATKSDAATDGGVALIEDSLGTAIRAAPSQALLYTRLRLGDRASAAKPVRRVP